jgi:hypothetical protein
VTRSCQVLRNARSAALSGGRFDQWWPPRWAPWFPSWVFAPSRSRPRMGPLQGGVLSAPTRPVAVVHALQSNCACITGDVTSRFGRRRLQNQTAESRGCWPSKVPGGSRATRISPSQSDRRATPTGAHGRSGMPSVREGVSNFHLLLAGRRSKPLGQNRCAWVLLAFGEVLRYGNAAEAGSSVGVPILVGRAGVEE